MDIPRQLQTSYAPDSPELIGLIRAGVLGGAFNPLTSFGLTPHLALDDGLDGSSKLVAGGSEAGFLGDIATFGNPGDGSDAVQTTEASQTTNLSLIGGLPYGYCPGVVGNGFSVPDEAALDITSALTMDVKFIARDYTPESSEVLISKYDYGANKRAYLMELRTTGKINFIVDPTGSSPDTSESTSAISASDKWARVKFFPGSQVVFYTSTVDNPSDDDTDWTQLGSAVSISINSIAVNDAELTIGANLNNGLLSNTLNGAIRHARIYASTDGTDKRLDVDFTKATHGAETLTAETGQTVTLNRTGNNPAAFIGKSRARPDGADDFWSITDGSIPLNAVSGVMLGWHGTLNDVSGVQALVTASTALNADTTRAAVFINSGALVVGGRRADDDSFQSVSGGAVSQYEECTIVGVIDYASATATVYKNGEQVSTGAFHDAGQTSASNSLSTRVFRSGASNYGSSDIGQAYIYQKAFSATEVLKWHNEISKR